jgi:hypothetical protein
LDTLSKTRRGSRQGSGNVFLSKVIYARKGFRAYLPLIIAAVLLLVAALVEALIVNEDVLDYQCYAAAFWYGTRSTQILPLAQCQFLLKFAPFHTFPLEYPPLTLAIFSLPLIGPVSSYPLLFGFCMALTAAFIFWLLLRYGLRGSGFIFIACLLVGCLGTAFARFDLVPAALTLLSILLAQRKHWTLSYVALALGTLIKLFPVVLFPLLFLAEQRDQPGFYVPDLPITLKNAPEVFRRTFHNMRRWHWKNAAVFAIVVLGVMAFFAVLHFNSAFSSFSYLYLRPVEIESTGSVLIWLASSVGAPLGWVTSFGSLNTVSPLAAVVSQGLFILLVVGFIYIVIQQWTGKIDLVRASLSALLVLLATSKVFSPQYLLWLIPLLAYGESGNRRLLLYWGGISVLTSLIYPVYFGMVSLADNPALVPGFLPAIFLRDAAFVLLTLAYLLDWLHLRARKGEPETV